VTTIRLAFVLMLLALASNATAAGTQADPPGIPTVIRAREQALADAMHARDSQRLEQLLALDYILRGTPDIDRATWIRNAVTLCWGDRSEIEHFDARPLGDVVVASFELTVHVDPATCQPARLRSLITDIWIRQADGWRLRIRHAAAAPAADADLSAQYGAVPLPPPTWEISSELSLVATAGNTSTRTLGLAGDVTHRGLASSTTGSVTFLTSEADEITRARSLSAEARHAFHVGGRVEPFVRGAYARDRFAGIANRATVDVGAAYTARVPKPHSLTAEGGLGFTAEQRLDGTDLRHLAAATAVDYAWTRGPGVELKEHVGLNADLESAGNWRAAIRTALGIALTRLLSFKVSHAFEYRHAPVTGFRRMDMRTAAALVLSFQQRPDVSKQ